MSGRSVSALSTTALLLAAPASASVLTEDRADELCTASLGGSPAVDQDALALALVTAANATPYLDGANPTGSRNGAIDLAAGASAQGEPVYAVYNVGRALNPANDRPFGPAASYASERVKAARSALEKEVTDLVAALERGFATDGDTTYRVVQVPVLGADPRDPRALFLPSPPARLVCERTQQATGVQPSRPQVTTKAQRSGSAISVRLRGTIEDLWVGQNDLADTEPAEVAFNRDAEADTNTVSLEGVGGISFADPDGAWQLIPFSAYERTETDGQDGDVNALTPGLLLAYAWVDESASVALDLGIESSVLFDLEQEARKANLRAYLDPAFKTPLGALFGAYLLPSAPVRIRPELSLLAESGWILDAGESAQFEGDQSYLGLGGDLSVMARLNAGQPLSDFVLKGGVRYLRLAAGDIGIEDVRRWRASLGYAPQNLPYFGLEASFEEGENAETFQSEEFYRLGVTLRY